MKKKLSLIIITVLAMHANVFSQKAYDVIYYRGTTQNINVKFTLANGYINASEIQTIDRKTKRVSKFLAAHDTADNDGKMKFYHHSTSGKTFSDYFILDIQDYYQHVPAKIRGKYYFNRTAYRITLSRYKY
jgi:hypothetical protein